MLGLVDGRLITVYDGPLLYSNARATCEPETLTQSLSALDVLAKDGSQPSDIAVQVSETRECVRAGKSAKPAEKLYSFRLTWDAKRKRYTGGSKELYLLKKKRIGG